MAHDYVFIPQLSLRFLLTVFFLIQPSASFSKDYRITDFGALTGKISTTAIQKLSVNVTFIA